MMNGSIEVRYLLVAVLGLALASCLYGLRTPSLLEGRSRRHQRTRAEPDR